MVQISRKIYVDDLIIEYAVSKVCNGYDISFTASEFMDFLDTFMKKYDVKDVIKDREALFIRFFERKTKNDWTYLNEFHMKTTIPRLEMDFDSELNDYVINVNYELTSKDLIYVGTNYMNKFELNKVRNSIFSYQRKLKKRDIKQNVEVTEECINVGKRIAVELIFEIWKNYTFDLIKQRNWPKQCTDIFSYLFDFDLAKVINVESIKDKFIEFYKDISINIAKMYKEDPFLRISSNPNNYLAYSNFQLIFQKYFDIMNKYFISTEEELYIDLSVLQFAGSKRIGSISNINGDKYNKKDIDFSYNEEEKKLIKLFDYK